MTHLNGVWLIVPGLPRVVVLVEAGQLQAVYSDQPSAHEEIDIGALRANGMSEEDIKKFINARTENMMRTPELTG